MRSPSGTICGIGVENDVTGPMDFVVHLKGSLTIVGTVSGDTGDITC